MQIEFIEKCIKDAEEYRSKLIPQVLELHGMSGHKIKHFLNNILSSSHVNYLEIGAYKGATFASAQE